MVHISRQYNENNNDNNNNDDDNDDGDDDNNNNNNNNKNNNNLKMTVSKTSQLSKIVWGDSLGIPSGRPFGRWEIPLAYYN